MDSKNQDAINKQKQEEIYHQYHLHCLGQHAIESLKADGVLLVGLYKDPQKEGRIWFDFEQIGIEAVEMIGIINRLMGDVNKHFVDAQLDPPFPQAKEFIRPVPQAEGQ
ncbi:hypothetical protein [Spirosoma oryzicola]|uniref:hypothetical protein n=1 Tax=Spirosoma oryzicola TaxID=2898794 RepID=UPI001E334A33|nr:hypothetical protein [Spirosoma oryzicola]UHG93460.1 hypothetical protein LQ777_11260 [Spirosoma oryzicola]